MDEVRNTIPRRGAERNGCPCSRNRSSCFPVRGTLRRAPLADAASCRRPSQGVPLPHAQQFCLFSADHASCVCSALHHPIRGPASHGRQASGFHRNVFSGDDGLSPPHSDGPGLQQFCVRRKGHSSVLHFPSQLSRSPSWKKSPASRNALVRIDVVRGCFFLPRWDSLVACSCSHGSRGRLQYLGTTDHRQLVLSVLPSQI